MYISIYFWYTYIYTHVSIYIYRLSVFYTGSSPPHILPSTIYSAEMSVFHVCSVCFSFLLARVMIQASRMEYQRKRKETKLSFTSIYCLFFLFFFAFSTLMMMMIGSSSNLLPHDFYRSLLSNRAEMHSISSTRQTRGAWERLDIQRLNRWIFLY